MNTIFWKHSPGILNTIKKIRYAPNIVILIAGIFVASCSDEKQATLETGIQKTGRPPGMHSNKTSNLTTQSSVQASTNTVYVPINKLLFNYVTSITSRFYLISLNIGCNGEANAKMVQMKEKEVKNEVWSVVDHELIRKWDKDEEWSLLSNELRRNGVKVELPGEIRSSLNKLLGLNVVGEVVFTEFESR